MRSIIPGVACLLVAGSVLAEPPRPGGGRPGVEPQQRSSLREAVESHRTGRDLGPMPERRLSPQDHAELREQLRMSAERRGGGGQGRR